MQDVLVETKRISGWVIRTVKEAAKQAFLPLLLLQAKPLL